MPGLRLRCGLVAALWLSAPLVHALGRNPESPDLHPPTYTRLVFSDEFDGKSLDRSKWCTRYQHGGGPALQVPDKECQVLGVHGTLDFLNKEQQRYVDVNARGEGMHVVSEGMLRLRATKTGKDRYVAYEAAMIRSKAEFRPSARVSYYITARLRSPKVRGVWPAFWLAPGVDPQGKTGWPPEIDIFEAPYNGKDMLETTVRIGGQTQNWGGQGAAAVPPELLKSVPTYQGQPHKYVAPRSLRDTWVESAVEWSEHSACYFVDGLQIGCERYEWKHNNGELAPPSPLLLNLAVGDHWAASAGIDDDRFPTSFDIDHVRVYEKQDAPRPPLPALPDGKASAP